MRQAESTSREQTLNAWLSEVVAEPFTLSPLGGDASFRHYIRLHKKNGSSYIIMDAPPQHEDVRPFVHVADILAQAGLRTPKIIAQNIEQGFLLLEDFSDVTWSTALLHQQELPPLLEDALRQLHLLQAIPLSQCQAFPCFDAARIQQECALWTDWYLPHVAKNPLDEDTRQRVLDELLQHFIVLTLLPQAAVHLDYHSRNLMLPADGVPLGVIDFQDAVIGPITYDLASLLYDCYQDYPEKMRKQWSHQFYSQLAFSWRNEFADEDEWHQILRLTAMQRHIKAIGIFSRLAFRDGKTQFLDEIPLTHKHLQLEIEDVVVLSEETRQLLER